MKTIKTIFAVIVFVLLFTFLPSSQKVAYAYSSGYFTYDVTDGQATITGYTGSNINISIPATLDGFTVVGIGNNAFKDNAVITSVSIPDTVTSIGGFAFYYCSSLTNVQIPDSVTMIGDSAFAYNISLQNITLPNNLQTIANCVFQDCKALTSITIPNTVTSIGIYSFCECFKLSSIVIPPNVASIGEGAFKDCKVLASATMNDSLQNIGKYVFYGCSLLSNVTLPSQITNIPDFMFYRCYALKNITIPGTVTSIGWSSFEECSSLTNIALPNKVTSIGIRAFLGCTVLQNVVFPNSIKTISDNAFAHCYAFTNIVIPDGVTKIGDYSFYYCTALKEVTVSPSLTDIGFLTFDACDPSFTLKGVTGSYVQNYAVSNNISFVDPNPVEMLTFNQTTQSLKVGEGFAIVASVSPSTASNQTITWSSSNTNVAVVSNAGYVTAVGNGTAIITARSVAGSKTATCTIDVTTQVSSVSLNALYKTLKIGEEFQLAEIVYPQTASNKSRTWQTSNANVATISSTGVVKAVGNGTAIITVKTADGEKTATCTVTVIPADVPFKDSTPTNLVAIDTNYKTISLTWSAVPGADSYKLYVATASAGKYTLLANVTTLSYISTGLDTGKTYYYKVVAYQKATALKSRYSAIVHATPNLSKTSSLIASKVSKTSIKLTVKPVSGATGYVIYRATSLNGTYINIATTKSTTYTNTSLSKKRTYYYKVKAYRLMNNIKVYSGYSTIIKIGL